MREAATSWSSWKRPSRAPSSRHSAPRPVRRAPDRGARRRRVPPFDRGDHDGRSPDVVTSAGGCRCGQMGDRPASRTNGSSWPAGGTSARRTLAIHSSRRRSRHSASSDGPPCSTGRWPASGCSSAPDAGSDASAASRPSACTARRERRSRSPGATTCRRSPTPRSSRRAPGRCCGRCCRPRRRSLRRTWVGLAGFAALEIATFVRYTDVAILGCAVVAVFVAWRLPGREAAPPGAGLVALARWRSSARACLPSTTWSMADR